MLPEIHPVAWACRDPKFGNALAHRLAVTEIAEPNTFHPDENAGLRIMIFPGGDPFAKRLPAVHRRVDPQFPGRIGHH